MRRHKTPAKRGPFCKGGWLRHRRKLPFKNPQKRGFFPFFGRLHPATPSIDRNAAFRRKFQRAFERQNTQGNGLQSDHPLRHACRRSRKTSGAAAPDPSQRKAFLKGSYPFMLSFCIQKNDKKLTKRPAKNGLRGFSPEAGHCGTFGLAAGLLIPFPRTCPFGVHGDEKGTAVAQWFQQFPARRRARHKMFLI